MDPGARGCRRAQMGGWVAFTQAAPAPGPGHRALAAPLQHAARLSVSVEASLFPCTLVVMKGHDVACAASLGMDGCLCMPPASGC